MRESLSLAAPPVLVATGSHVGRMRETNEDRVFADPDRGSFAVIDGVGGQAAGEHAAEIALDTIRQRLQLQIGTPAERVREAIALANTQIREQAFIHPDRHGMACVLTLVLLQSGSLTAGHVGDTRLYKMRAGQLRKLTHDHSPIGEREDRGELSETEAMRHPRRNEVYREVGLEPRGPDAEDFIEVVEEPFESDAALLLCSDGLSDALSSAAIGEIIHRHAGNPTAVVKHLIDQANEASGKDNVSVVYVEGTAFASAIRSGRWSTPTVRGVNGTQLDLLRPKGASAANANAGVDAAGGADATLARAGADAQASAAARAARAGTRGSADADASMNAGVAGARAGLRGADANAGTGSRAGKALMLAIGAIAGIAITLGAAYLLRDRLIPLIPLIAPSAAPAATAHVAPRVLTVSAESAADSGGYRTIVQAMADARAGDTIQVAPGEYREQVVVTDGVTLRAEAPREAVLRAPAQAVQPWTAIIIPGNQHGSRVSGIKIAGAADAPIAIGIHVLGRASIDDVEVSGATIAGISLADGAMRVTGAFMHDNAGPGFALNGGDARLAHTVLVHNGTAVPSGIDIALSGTTHATFTGNVLTGDPLQRVRGLPADAVAAFRNANVILPPSAASAPSRPRAAAPHRATQAPASNR
jgi:serine/threonine protein phosphatase PrpC